MTEDQKQVKKLTGAIQDLQDYADWWPQKSDRDAVLWQISIYKIALAALTAKPIKLPDNMPCKGAPQYIWLQGGCDTGNASEWPEHPEAGVTWHTEQIHSDDVLYVTANNDEVQE